MTFCACISAVKLPLQLLSCVLRFSCRSVTTNQYKQWMTFIYSQLRISHIYIQISWKDLSFENFSQLETSKTSDGSCCTLRKEHLQAGCQFDCKSIQGNLQHVYKESVRVWQCARTSEVVSM